jgi:hypothetical protein
MSRVKIEDVSVRIPVFEATGLRLLRMPSFGRAKVGTRNISHAGALFIIHALSNIDLELEEGDRVCVSRQDDAAATHRRHLSALERPREGRREGDGAARPKPRT